MENYITRTEHEEFAKRIDAENHRLSKRISSTEDAIKQITNLTINVNRLADNMAQTLGELQKQGERLEQLENLPLKNWNNLKTAIITAAGTAVGTGIVTTIINNLMK